tara:strand:+ start:159 stop:1718 length:1560 start_codon:yes stop_codon:yes gene_type:complete
MGIPSYFVHIVKNYPNIIKQYKPNTIAIHNLYIDSNSIIYDAIQNVVYKKNDDNYENKIIKWTCDRLLYYINNISPLDKVFIAFDGVSPIAKLEQQRNRRYKTWYTNDFLNKNDSEKAEIWDTTAITPGSQFMKLLSKKIHDNIKIDKLNIIISTSNNPGEGEHKIFDYLRNNEEYHSQTNTVVYGLDADLIMLSLIHLKITPNIYLFRETPHFINSINSSLQPNSLYMLDIYELNEKLNIEMHNIQDKICTLDYIFICFLLGNDFMPHFPSLNIRTNGINYILNSYNKLFSNNKDKLINNNKINWKNLKKLIIDLSLTEESDAMAEMKSRNKLEKNLKLKYPDINTMESLMSMPLLDRKIEKYINIGDEGWQYRYYKELFGIEITDSRRQEICLNYLEGLEWNFKYYINGCPDWNWYYKYHYPPLLCDLVKYIPEFDTTFIANNSNKAIDPLVQLAYVLPRNSLHLLPEKIYLKLINNYDNLYKLDNNITYAFCRYLWEGHVNLPNIDIKILEKICLE